MNNAVYREEKPPSNDVVLYHGAAHSSRQSGNTKHLAREGDETSICGHVNLQYNQKGDIHGNKSSPYRGPDRVLGNLCTKCQRRLKANE